MNVKGCPDPIALSNALAQGADSRLQDHLAHCLTCAAEWRRLQELKQLYRELPRLRPDVPRRQAALERLLDAAAQEQVARPPARFRPRRWLLGAVRKSAPRNRITSTTREPQRQARTTRRASRPQEAEVFLRQALLDPRREIRESAQAGLATLRDTPSRTSPAPPRAP